MPEVLTRSNMPKVVHIPSQTSVGFEAVVPSDADGKDLARFLERSRLGRARTRLQPVFALHATELKWSPVSGMPQLKEFVDVVTTWARRRGYGMARDLRELRSGLEEIRGGRTAHAVMRKFAEVTRTKVETVLEEAYFGVGDGGLTVQLLEEASYRSDDPDPYRSYRCRYSLSNVGAKSLGEFDLGSVAMVSWLSSALTRILPHLTNAEGAQSYSPYEDRPSVKIENGVEVVTPEPKMVFFQGGGTAEAVGEKFAAMQQEDGLKKLVSSIQDGIKLLDSLKSWAHKFDDVLQKSLKENEGLPDGWVWQDRFVSYFRENDDRYYNQQRDVSEALHDIWLEIPTNKLQDVALQAYKAVKEPNGKAALSAATNAFKFMPHAEKGEHIAYQVSDLKAWQAAFSLWLLGGQKALSTQLRRAKK